MKSKIKTTLSVLSWILVVGLFAWLMIFLNNASTKAEDKEEAWVADAKTEAEKGWELVSENDNLKLFFDPARVQLMVEDKINHVKWFSNPENAENDSVAFGGNKSAVKAIMNVTYVDEQGSSYKINSQSDCIQNKTYSYEYKDGGVYVNLQFEKQAFEIPCFFKIEDDRFVASILNDEVKHHGKLKIAKIDFLPFFGAGNINDDGYLVVPDGSGALINFNNMKQTYQSYSQSVYGRNLAINVNSFLLCEKNATMPVFGIKRNDDAFLAVITSGEYQAEIKAEVSRKTTENNIAYSSVVYIQAENNTLMAGSNDEEVTTILSPQDIGDKPYEVSFFFLNKGAGYSEMAARYREYLVNEKGMEKTDSVRKAVHLNFLGEIMVQKTFLGVPYKTVEPLTSFEELTKIAKSLHDDSVNDFDVSMNYVAKGGTKSKIPTKLTIDSALGGKKGYLKAKDELENTGSDLFLIYDPINIWKFGNGFSSMQAARNATRSSAIQYQYKLTNGSKDTSKPYAYLVTPTKVPEIVSKLTNSAEKAGVSNLGLTMLGQVMYADYRKDNVSMNETGELFESALQSADTNLGRVMLDDANAYGFPYADSIINVPVNSSKYDVEDEAIPFYQMVVNGYANIYGEPVNASGNIRDELLRMAAFGVSPSFQLMNKSPEAIKDTYYRQYYATYWGDWKTVVEDTVKEFSSLDVVSGRTMVGYQMLDNNVSCTTYDNGVLVYVNYSKEDQSVDGITVKAQSFVVKEGK